MDESTILDILERIANKADNIAAFTIGSFIIAVAVLIYLIVHKEE